MTFHNWVIKESAKKKRSKTVFMRELAKKCGVSYQTLRVLERGGIISRYEKARAIVKATQGQVTIKELCE